MKGFCVALLAVLAAFVQTATAGKVVCYYGSWAYSRKGNGKYEVKNIDPTLCTHLVYSFAGLDAATNKIKSLDESNDLKTGKNGYKLFTDLVKKNSKLIPMLAVGGWSEGSEKYSKMAASAASRKTFIASVVALLREYKFKGLDVDWEYPTQRNGSPSDKANFVALLKELNQAFGKDFQLSIAVGVNKEVVNSAYDVKQIVKYVDHINLMLYDMHMASDGKTGHNAPYNEVEQAIKVWTDKGAPSNKLILGTGAYGRTFTLSDPKKNGPGSKTKGPGKPGPFTEEAGYLGYNEICESKWTIKEDKTWKAPYAYNGDQWVGYDNPASIKAKCQLARKLKLGGGMLWSIETDDFKNKCGGGANAITKALKANC